MMRHVAGAGAAMPGGRLDGGCVTRLHRPWIKWRWLALVGVISIGQSRGLTWAMVLSTPENSEAPVGKRSKMTCTIGARHITASAERQQVN